MSGRKCRVIGRFTAIITLILMVSVIHAADSLPIRWGEDDSNPPKPAVWKFERIWPDNLQDTKSYRPMIWKEDRWSDNQGTEAHYPFAMIEKGELVLGAAGPKLGSEFHKSPALTYIPKEEGVYGISGSAVLFESKSEVELLLMRKRGQKATLEGRFIIEVGRSQPLSRMAVELKKGDELAIVAWVRAANATSSVRIRDLKIGTELADASMAVQRRAVDNLPKAKVVEKPTSDEILAANQAVISRGEAGVIFPAQSGVINVKAFGAVGDGLHDDTEALRVAYSYGGLIYIPDGTYLVTGTIEPPVKSGRVPARRILQ